MPLIFVHGVANRPSAEQAAETAQRDELFRSLVFDGKPITILNPDWGSFAVKFSDDLRWIPRPSGNEAFGDDAAVVAPLEETVSLGQLAKTDVEQAIDLVAMAALDQAIVQGTRDGTPAYAAKADAVTFTKAAGAYLEAKQVFDDEDRHGSADLASCSNLDFAAALEAEVRSDEAERYGVGNTIRNALDHLAGLVGGGLSDLALRAKRQEASRSVSLFLGDIFVYLRGRDDPGHNGTRARIFKPVIDALISGAKAPRADGEMLVVVGHSLGGVILYDILTDPTTRKAVEDGIGGPIKIDALFTVGSQPGFFADLGLYAAGRPAAGSKLPRPTGVARWMNVFDFTDIFSFLCAPMFDGVSDYGYDTVTDVRYAHSAYSRRPSFYKRMAKHLQAAA